MIRRGSFGRFASPNGLDLLETRTEDDDMDEAERALSSLEAVTAIPTTTSRNIADTNEMDEDASDLLLASLERTVSEPK